jgi:hypothetical protein
VFSGLDDRRMQDKMSDMKKFTSREFQKRFGQITDQLRVGEVVQVTKRGKVIGRFEKAPEKKTKAPDFLAELKRHTYPAEVGDRLLQLFNETLS